MLFQEDFPANHLALPGSEKAKMMTVTSGLKCLELSQRCNQSLLLGKMLLASSEWHSTRCYLTWKHRTTPQKRILFQLAVKTLGIAEIEYGLWLTPTASDGIMSKKKTDKLYITETGTVRLRNKAGGSSNAGLANQVIFFPTPQAQEPGRKNIEIVDKNGEQPINLNQRFYDKKTGRLVQKGLTQIVEKFLPTPTTQDAKNNDSQSQMERNSLPLNAVAGGKLNPQWVEWLMGYPVGWTDLKD